MVDAKKTARRVGELEIFRKKYDSYRRKYPLPSFRELNEFFDIEDLAEKETDFFLRMIRRRLTEKTNSYLRFVEVFFNPAQAPLFFMILSKNLPENGRKVINELYVELGRIELMHFKAENKTSEKEEAKLIKEIFNKWKQIRDRMLLLHKIFEENWEKKAEGNNKTYFG